MLFQKYGCEAQGGNMTRQDRICTNRICRPDMSWEICTLAWFCHLAVVVKTVLVDPILVGR